MLTAHKILMTGLIDNPGAFRNTGVGIMKGKKVVHVAPPAKQVHELMSNLFAWLQTTESHPLVTSSVFHYEFEFIHPFQDGNGRMGRLWQSLILTKWNPVFANLPVESMVHKSQSKYYEVLNKSTQDGDSSVFIEFILKIILDSLKHPTPEVTPEVKKLLQAINGDMTRIEIQQKIGLKDEKHFREHYLKPAISNGFIEMTIPDKPNSRLQKYRLTNKAKNI